MGPELPSVGVGAAVVHEGKVALIRRGKEPLRGRWVVPGGTVEWGETLEQALVREVQEETGLHVRPRELLTVFDRIQREDGRVRYHYVIVDFLCEYVSGSLRAGSDATQAAWASPEELADYEVPERARDVILDAFRRVRLADPTVASPPEAV